MKLEIGKWSFNKDVSEIFDNHVAQSIPYYKDMQNMIKDMSIWFLEDGTKYFDIGASTGYTAMNIINNNDRDIEYNLIDNSSKMCNILRSYNCFNVIEEDLSINSDIFDNASLITSVLTMQFISKKDRQNVLNNVYKGLNDGSAFIMVEKVLGSSPLTEDMWNQLYHDGKLKRGLSKKHIFDKSRSIRGVMKPLTLEENIEMLKVSGFKEIEVFFKNYNFVGILAVK